jgi:hypothetical protein
MARACRQFDRAFVFSARGGAALLVLALWFAGRDASAQEYRGPVLDRAPPQVIHPPEFWLGGMTIDDPEQAPRDVLCEFRGPPEASEPTAPTAPMPLYDAAQSGAIASPVAAAGPEYEAQPCDCETWQLLPKGLIYHSYMAGAKEPRFATMWLQDKRYSSFWDITLGFREGILRHGTEGAECPQGFQVDIAGAAFPRLLPAQKYDLMSTDFRFGIPVTYGVGRYQMKIEPYHISDHMGDEYEVSHPGLKRVDYSWDAVAWGHSYYVTDDLRVYGEFAYAYAVGGGAKPMEFQFGVDYSPMKPFSGLRGLHCCRGAPFFALNADFRETVDYEAGLIVQTGWQFRGENSHVLRLGMEFFSGKSDQYEFFARREQKIGLGIWYDF